MNLRSAITQAVLVMLLSMPVGVAEAGGLAKAAARGAAKSASRSVGKTATQTLRRDLLRDRKTPVRVLRRDRHAFRYATRRQAQQELRRGVGPGSHLTSRATPGRPPSALRARSTYGLPQKPEVRERIHLKRGQPVRFNRVLSGKPGKGEFTSPKRIPPEAIEQVVVLPRGKK